MRRHRLAPLLALLTLAAPLLLACAAPSKALAPSLAPIAAPVPPPEDPFKRDQVGGLDEAALQQLLQTPLVLDERARVGVVPVASAYGPDGALPLTHVPAVLGEALEGTGHFEVASEVATDWPADRGLPGLRELGARYRAPYLLLYRHRFVDRSWTNAWGVTWLTLVGGLVTPNQTLEAAGVLEATLYDVRTGALLFTVHERVSARTTETVWQNERKLRELRERLLRKGAEGLATQVVDKVQRLASVRPPRPPSTQAASD